MEKFHPSISRQVAYGAAAFALAAVAMGAVPASAFGADPLLPYAAAFIFCALYVAASAAQARLTTYSVENDSLVMERDFFSHERRLIPLKSIDNLHVKSSFFARLLSVCDVYVDTPGGFGYELNIRDAPLSRAEDLMSEVNKAKKGA